MTAVSSVETPSAAGRRLLSSSSGWMRPSSIASPPINQPRWFSSKTEETKEEEKKEEDTTTAATTEDATEDTAAETSISKEDELNAQIKELKNQLLRSYAEQENIRHIARNDVQAANSFAIKKFAKSLLDVADNLDRALEAVGEDQKQSPEFQSFFQGIEMTRSGLSKALQSNGVTTYCEEPGDVFNPEQHEALMEYPDPTATPGTVGQVIKKGYMLNGRVLRPAEVGVVKK
jgi:molecular chaperone GrpE